MPDDEGLALHDAGARPRARSARCSRSAPTAGSRRCTSAPRHAPRARCCSPSTTTAGPRRTRPAGSTTTSRSSIRETGRMDTLPFFRRTIEAADLEDVVVGVVGHSVPVARRGQTPLGVPVHRRRPRRRRRDGRLRGLVSRTSCRAARSRSTTCSKIPADGGQAPFHVWQRAVADGFEPVSTTGSLRICG